MSEAQQEQTERDRNLIERVVKSGIIGERAHAYAIRYFGLVTEDELVQIGWQRALSVVQTYEAERASFDDYVRRRIDWVMLDSIKVEARERRMDRAALRAAAELLALCRETDPRADPVDRLEGFAEAVAAATFVAMTLEAQRDGEEDVIAREEYATAMNTIEEALGALPKGQRRLMELVYCDNRTLLDAQKDLKAHYNTVLRWHDQVLAQVKEKLVRQGITKPPERGGGPWLSVIRGGRDKPES